MNQFSKSALVILAVIVVLGLLIATLAFLPKSEQPPSTDSANILDDAANDGEQEAGDGSRTRTGMSTPGLPVVDDSLPDESPRTILLETYREKTPIGPAMSRLAKIEGWSYDDLVGNVQLWEQFCKRYKNEREVSNSIGWQADRGMLCKSLFRDWQSHFEDLGMIKLEQLGQGSALNELIQDQPSEVARDLLIERLDAALRAFNEIQVGEAVWALGFQQLLSPPLQELGSESYGSVDGFVLMSVTAALYCDEIGGCGAGHPIVLRQCYVLTDRPCYQPGDIFDAVRQTHTGLQEATFWSIYDQIRARLASHRR